MCQAIVNPCNTVGAMGLGVAKAIRDRYPSVYQPYRRACKVGEVTVGSVWAVKPTEGGLEWVVNLPTKRHWYDLSNVDDVVTGLLALREWIISNQIQSIAIPALGAGNGWLNWDIVRKLILRSLRGLSVNIDIYFPFNAELPQAVNGVGMKYLVIYVHIAEGRCGFHGYMFDTLPAARFAKVPNLVTPDGYRPKLSGVELKNVDFDPTYKYPDGVCRVKESIVKRETSEIAFVDGWCSPEELFGLVGELDCEHVTVMYTSMNGVVQADKPAEWVRVQKAGIELNLKELNKSKGVDREGVLYAVRNWHYDGRRLFTFPYAQHEYWEADKNIPPVLTHKWSYTLTSEIGLVQESNGVKYHEYFLGDHAKSNDELDVLGKEDPETGFALVWMKDNCPVLDELATLHKDVLWEGRRMMERYEVIGMVNINTLTMPKTQFELRNFGTSVFQPTDYNRRLVTGAEDLVSLCLTPPKISYRILDIRDDFRQVLDSYLGSNRLANVHYTDVTKLFVVDGKVTGIYGQTTDMLSFEMANHVGDSRKVQFIRGLDMPPRAVIANAAPNIKAIKLVAWPFSHLVYRYGMILETDDAVSLWAAGYSGKMFCL